MNSGEFCILSRTGQGPLFATGPRVNHSLLSILGYNLHDVLHSNEDWPNVKRYARLFATYILIAVAVVLIYAPWGLALRPWDYDILRAGMSIIVGIGLAGVFGTSTYLALKDPDVKLLEPSHIMDDDEVIPVLEEYVDAPYVGGIAADALEQVRSAGRKKERLRKVIGMQFSEGSISWDRFTSLVDTAERTVIRNAALVANNVQSFDREGYAKEKGRRRNAQTSDRGNEQLALYDESLAHMREIVTANDRVLLEMGKLELELSKLEADDTLQDNNETVEELQSLIDETRYYR